MSWATSLLYLRCVVCDEVWTVREMNVPVVVSPEAREHDAQERALSGQVECRYCQRRGLVRIERVIRGTRSLKAFYCGGCNREWETPLDD